MTDVADTGVGSRVDAADWRHIADELDAVGCALVGELLTPDEATSIAALYDHDHQFRSTIDMARYRFGQGGYRYFSEPLPAPVAALREALYPRLLPVARQWWTRLGRPTPWPDTLEEWLDECHAAGQTRPTPLLLRYGQGDWNALHRDLYGDLVFPLQVVVNLSRPGIDHTGGEFVVCEQRPRAQSRATATVIPHCQAMAFTTRDRPLRTARGWSAAAVRHGVSVVRSGHRMTLGLVFHDAA